MVNSINTNLAAYYAQSNISAAAKANSSFVSQLSSGNRIVTAATDIAALAIGTSLATGVSSLRTALTNAAQGNSLLQVADGALSQITAILQRQKAITSQASSGSLSGTERAFLNQEFQALTDEIDRIATSTNFNNVKLLDGGIAGSTAIGTSSADGASTGVSGSASILTFATAAPADGDTVTIGGVVVTFTTSAQGTSGAVGKVSVGSSATNTAANLVAYLNQLNDPRLASLNFTAAGGVVSVNYTGGDLAASITLTVSSGATTAANLTAANLTIAPSTVATGLDINRTFYTGHVTGSLLASASIAAQNNGGPLNLNAVEDNAAFVGKLGQGQIGNFTAQFVSAENVIFALQVGNITYTSATTDIVAAGALSTATFTGRNQFGVAEGGTFTLSINGSTLVAADVASQIDANEVANQLNQALSGVTFVQNRDITSLVDNDIIQLGGIDIANLQGFSADFQSGDFSNVQISSLTIDAPAAGSTDSIWRAIINGEEYVSSSSIGNQIGEGKVIALTNVNDSSKRLTFVTGQQDIASSTTTVLDLGTQEKADAIADAIKAALGIGEGGNGLSFQVGNSSSDVLNVTVGSATTASLFGGATLDVLTQDSAAAASAAVSSAISAVTAVRANVGALQSRFDFASQNIATALQNQDAARGELLDTDIAVASTGYATAQVKLQAGISVLAQANQQLQALLKLIG
jgi:flagellin